MEITEENIEEVTGIASNIVEELIGVEEEQTTENLEVVIGIIEDTAVVVGNNTFITEQVSTYINS